MVSPVAQPYSVVDDKELDDAALWAVIDSAAASHPSSKFRKPLAIKLSNSPIPIPNFNQSPPFKPSKHPPRNHHHHYSSEIDSRALTEGEVVQEPWKHHHHRPQKIARYCVSEMSESSPPPPPPPPPPLAVVKHLQRTPTTSPVYSPLGYSVSSPGSGMFCVNEQCSVSHSEGVNWRQSEEKVDSLRHSLSGQFPSVSLFKEYQNAAMAILEKGDFTMISGSPFIKKSGWRKISFYFNLSYEIKDKTIEFDDNRNVQRAEFVVRAYMQGGRFSDGWGSCERREKRFLKPNHDIPSTAETRAKNKACQDLLGIGEYRPGASHGQR